MNVKYDDEHGTLIINGKDINSDDGECFYVERLQIENIKLGEIPLEISLAVCSTVHKNQSLDISEYVISKINKNTARVSFSDGLMNEDFKVLTVYEVTCETWMKTKIDVISKLAKENCNIYLEEDTTEENTTDDDIFINHSITVEGDNLGTIIRKADIFSQEIEDYIDNELRPVSKDIDSLMGKTDIIQRFFEDTYGFSLIKSYNLNSIMNLKKDVNDIDDLTVRLKNLVTQLIENINKMELDKGANCSSKGSRISLENFLKVKFNEDTQIIEDEISLNLWAVYNLRTEYVHEKNRNYKKALTILNLKETDSPQFVWRSCIKATLHAFTKVLDLIMQGKYEEEGEYFVQLAREKLITIARFNIANLILENKSAEVALHILVNVKEISDSDLAKKVGQDLVELRKNLYPFLSQIILYSYIDSGQTVIRIIDEILPIVREIISSHEN